MLSSVDFSANSVVFHQFFRGKKTSLSKMFQENNPGRGQVERCVRSRVEGRPV